MALKQVPSLPHLNIVGSVVTGTHGSGYNNQTIASYVRAISFVDANGNVKKISKEADGKNFDKFLNSFGTLGVVYEMTMEITDEFWMQKCIYEDVKWDGLVSD